MTWRGTGQKWRIRTRAATFNFFRTATDRTVSSSPACAAAYDDSMAETGTQTSTGPICPCCGADCLRPTNLPGRYRCIACLHRFELRSDCPNCGNHATIARMTDTANVTCRNCGGSMLNEI
jgi:hypothetical protein